MPLDNEKIKALLAKKNAPRTRSTGSRGSKVNPNDRSYQAWFALNHELYDKESGEPMWCDNPDCIDPRDKTHGQPVVSVNGKNMCRYCFIDGWLLANSEQMTIPTPTP